MLFAGTVLSWWWLPGTFKSCDSLTTVRIAVSFAHYPRCDHLFFTRNMTWSLLPLLVKHQISRRFPAFVLYYMLCRQFLRNLKRWRSLKFDVTCLKTGSYWYLLWFSSSEHRFIFFFPPLSQFNCAIDSSSCGDIVRSAQGISSSCSAKTKGVPEDKCVVRLSRGTFLPVFRSSHSWYIFGNKISPLLLEWESPSVTGSTLYFGMGWMSFWNCLYKSRMSNYSIWLLQSVHKCD